MRVLEYPDWYDEIYDDVVPVLGYIQFAFTKIQRANSCQDIY